MLFRPWAILIVLLIFLLNQIDASRYRSLRPKRDVCPDATVDMCLFVICENGAQCQQDLNTDDCYKCICPAGFTGKVCDTPIAILPVGCSPGCQNNGFCNNNVCICPTGYSGTFCEIRDYCLPTNPCQNSGQCISNTISYQCDCTGTGYTGPICTDIVPTDPCSPSPCENGGQCSSNNGLATCLCINGYFGAYCQIAPVPCAATPCENGGQCELLASNAYGCVCLANFTGIRCETYILTTHPCVTMPDSLCLNGGTCTVNDADYLCKCAPLYTGEKCEFFMGGVTTPTIPPLTPPPVTDPANFCYSNPCRNGGTCYENSDAFRCDCPALWGGPTCVNWLGPMTTTPDPITITGNVCPTNPCNNGGSCYSSGTTFTCVCPPSFTGVFCDIFEATTPFPFTTPGVPMTCADQPCKNGGSCVPMGNSYSCFCGLSSIYTGKNCDSTTPMPVDECPINCTPARCIFSGFPTRPYACLWYGNMYPPNGKTG